MLPFFSNKCYFSVIYIQFKTLSSGKQRRCKERSNFVPQRLRELQCNSSVTFSLIHCNQSLYAFLYTHRLHDIICIGQFYFTGTGFAIFDNYRKLSRKYKIKLTVISGGKPPTPIISIPVYCSKNKRMQYC